MNEQEHRLIHIGNPLHLYGEEGHECESLTGHNDILCLMNEIDILGIRMSGVVSQFDF